MKYFIVEGDIQNAGRMDSTIMAEHKEYTQKSMDGGMVLMSALKADLSGGVFIMKSESRDEIEDYFLQEPFRLHGIQDYRIVEFQPHYCNPSPGEWFQ